MKLIPTALLLACAAVAVAGCAITEADKAQRDRRYTDSPATLSCYDYGMTVFEGRSKGKPQRSDTGEGSWSFVDAATGKLTTVEANCMVIYD